MSKRENWDELRERTKNAVEARTIEKTADVIAENAVKLERAKGLAIDRIIRALETMPRTSATNLKQYTQKNGKKQSEEYNLLELVTALEKMQKSEDSKPVNDAVKIIIDV